MSRQQSTLQSSVDRAPPASQYLLAGIALFCFACHASWQVVAGTPMNLLWACHTAALCVGLGLLFNVATLTAVGGLLLLVGLPSWLGSIAYSGEFIPTSVLTHVGGLVCAVLGLRGRSYPRNAPLFALAMIGALLFLARTYTTPDMNINVAFSAGAIPYYRSQTAAIHLLLVLAFWAIALLIADAVLRWLVEFHATDRQSSKDHRPPANASALLRH